MDRGHRQNGNPGQMDHDVRPAARPAPGKTTPTSRLAPGREAPVQRKMASPAPVQRAVQRAGRRDSALDAAMDAAHRGGAAQDVQARGNVAAEDPESVRRTAAAGVSGGGSALPHMDRIQAAFGSAHDLGGVRAHVGGDAATASAQIGATAYATGNDIAFQSQPDLHTAAHEAAHVVQQRSGVSLSGGVGQAGDSYERQADAVADAVVRGESAEPLLGAASAGASTTEQTGGVQRKPADPVAAAAKGAVTGGVAGAVAPGATAAPVAPTTAPAPADPAKPAPLTTAQRNALHTLLASRLNSAFTKYAVAAEEVNDKLEAEAAARVELVMTLLGIGFIFAAPAMGNAIKALVNQIPAGASTTTYRAALGIMSQADQIAGTMAELGKTAAKPAVSAALANGSEDYLAALSQGFSLMIDQIVGNVATNIENPAALPDAQLWLYVSQWDPQNVTQSGYERSLYDSARAFRRQVEPIGTPVVQELGGATNLGRDVAGQWHLYEEYSRGRYMRETLVTGSMLEGALHRSFAEFKGPWNMIYIGEETITGGETAMMFKHGDNEALRREYARYNQK